MRALVPIALFLAAASQAQAQTAERSHALILVRSDRVGRAVHPDALVHGFWVMWPHWWDATGLARFLSPLSGMDWQGDAQATAFRVDASGAFATPVAAADWERRGLGRAAANVVGSWRVTLLKRPNGTVTREGLAAAIDPEMRVRLLPFESTIQGGRLVVYDAINWDDATDVARRVNGRVIMVVYPAARSERWSPFWISGKGWPDGVPGHGRVQGLIDARAMGRLLLAPERFQWSADESTLRGGPNQWLALYDRVRLPFLAMFGAVAAIAGLWSAWLVHSERRGRVAGLLILTVFLAIPATAVGGAIARVWGPHLWAHAIALSLAGLAMVAAVSMATFRRAKGTHHLLGLAIVSATVLMFVDPVWSALSAQLGSTAMKVSPEAVGALVASIAAVFTFAQGRSTSVRVTAGVFVLAAILLGLLTQSWWIRAPAAPVVLVLAVLAGVGLVRLASLGAIALALFTVFEAGGRSAWAPLDRFARYEDAEAINLAHHAHFFGSPAFLLGGAIVAAGLILGGRFLLHQIKRLAHEDPRRLGLWRAGLLLLAIGLVQPFWLHAGLVTLFAGIGVLLLDGVWSL